MRNLIEQFKAARRSGTPLVAIETPDPAATMSAIVQGMNGKNPPFLQWDIIQGLIPMNENGSTQIKRLDISKEELAMRSTNPTEMLSLLAKLQGESIVFMHNAQRFIDSESVMQAIWNLRDIFKGRMNTLVLLGPSISLPAELTRDVIVMDEPLPDDESLGAIADTVYQSARAALVDLKDMTKKQRADVVRASRGLSAFSAEQAISMSVTPKAGIDVTELWERKRKMIEQTKGLQVYTGGESFDDIGGIARIKEFGARLFSNIPPTAIIWIDEMEKAMAGSSGAGGDTSGTSQDQLGVLLNAMNDNEWAGQICVGPPGCAKSLYAKSLGTTNKVPVIKLDLGAMKGSLVGQSEQQIRAAIKIILAVAGKGAYWVATCNQLESLKPELRRRFTDGVWYFDLPDDAERSMIWTLLRSRYKIDPRHDQPDDTRWTGADIRNVCSIAYRLNVSLVEAASYITPVAVSDPKSIDRLRDLASGAFLSASTPGVYRKAGAESWATQADSRKISV